jgi:hypothetical protein
MQPAGPPAKSHKWWLIPVFAIITIAILVSVPAPIAVRWYLEDWLTSQGVEKVEIGDVRVNLIAGRVAVSDLSFYVDNRRQEVGALSANLEWSSLAANRLHFSSIRLEDADTTAKYTDKGGLVLASIALEVHEAVEDIGDIEEKSEWQFGVDLLEISNMDVFDRDQFLIQGAKDGNYVKIEKGRVENLLTWEPDEQVGIDAHFSGGDQHLYVKGTGTPFRESSVLDLALDIQDLEIDDFATTLEMIGVSPRAGVINGKQRIRATLGEADGSFKIDLSGSLAVKETDFSIADTAIKAQELSWQGEINIDSEKDSLAIGGKGVLALVDAKSELQSDMGVIGGATIGWDGQFNYGNGDGNDSVTGQGTLNGSQITFRRDIGDSEEEGAGTALDIAADGLESSSTGWTLAFASDDFDFDWAGDITLATPSFGRDGYTVTSKQIDWSGDAGFATKGDSISINLDGALTGESAEVGGLPDSYSLDLKTFDWQGSADISEGDRWSGAVSGDAKVDDISMIRPGADAPILTVKSVAGSFDPADESGIGGLKDIGLEDLRFLHREGSEGPPEILSIPRADIDRIVLSGDEIVVGNIVTHDLVAWLEIDEEGNVEYRELLDRERNPDALADRAASRETAAKSQQTDSDDKIGLSIDGVRTVGESRLDFRARTVTPVVSVTVTSLDLALGKLDWSRPDQDTPMHFELAVGKYTTGSFDGTIRPLGGTLSLKGKGTVGDMDIALFDGYVRRNTGYAVQSGTLGAKLDVDLVDDILDSTADLTIRHLELRKLDPDEEDPLAEDLGISLSAGLALLEDRNETIRIEVPIEGDLTELSTGFGDAFRQVMQKGMVTGIRTAATMVFAPLWPVLAVQQLWQKGRQLHFQPVIFPAGSAEITAGQSDYLQEMAGIAVDRPKVNLSLCGIATRRDRQTFFPETTDDPVTDEEKIILEALESERQEVVKDRLLELGVEAKRLVMCTSRYEKGRDGEPRVEVGS